MQMPPESAAKERRRQTRNAIYRHIYNASGVCTKQSLARELCLSLPTIYQHLSELIEAGLVAYSGEQHATGGRRAAGLTIAAGARFAVGASITEKRLRLVAADLRLGELFYRDVPCELTEHLGGYGGFLCQELERFLDEGALDRERLLGVGLSLPGVLSSGGDRLILAPTLHLQDVALADLAASIPYPFYIENDATGSGYAEWFLRRGRRNMAYLSLENGVGGAVLTNGGGYAGDNRRSGEFGHMCVEPGGLRCKCGRRGCLEAYCSAGRIGAELGVTLEEFFAGLEREPSYQALWEDILRHLAVGIHNIRMVLDCEVVLGGCLSEYLGPYLPLLRRYVQSAGPFADDADFVQLSVLRSHIVPLGAALHFIREFLDNI